MNQDLVIITLEYTVWEAYREGHIKRLCLFDSWLQVYQWRWNSHQLTACSDSTLTGILSGDLEDCDTRDTFLPFSWWGIPREIFFAVASMTSLATAWCQSFHTWASQPHTCVQWNRVQEWIQHNFIIHGCIQISICDDVTCQFQKTLSSGLQIQLGHAYWFTSFKYFPLILAKWGVTFQCSDSIQLQHLTGEIPRHPI